MYIQEVAKQSGVSVRTLHYYDEIGLLKPDKISPSGYRVYQHNSLKRLQKILFYRELDFPLSKIKQLLDNPWTDENRQMEQQLELLKLKHKRLQGIIRLLEDQLKGEDRVSIKEFNMDEIRDHEEKYRVEVEEKYGSSDAYKESKKRAAQYGPDDWQKIQQESDAIYQALADQRQADPADAKVQSLIQDWQDLISRHFYVCTDEILAGLGEIYRSDDRFRKNIDKYGEGLSDFMADAITHYTNK